MCYDSQSTAYIYFLRSLPFEFFQKVLGLVIWDVKNGRFSASFRLVFRLKASQQEDWNNCLPFHLVWKEREETHSVDRFHPE
jgi:hypothetical protein